MRSSASLPARGTPPRPAQWGPRCGEGDRTKCGGRAASGDEFFSNEKAGLFFPPPPRSGGEGRRTLRSNVSRGGGNEAKVPPTPNPSPPLRGGRGKWNLVL